MQVEYRQIEMKRDMDLIRDLLMYVEDDPRFDGHQWFSPDVSNDFVIEGRTLEEVNYHLDLLIEAGLIKGKSGAGFGGPVVNKLTWEGHEFIDDIRDHGIWSQTKERLKGLPSVALSVVAEIAKSEIKKKLKLP
jgi:hypothetical protein